MREKIVQKTEKVRKNELGEQERMNQERETERKKKLFSFHNQY